MPLTPNETSDLRYFLGRSDYNKIEPCLAWEDLNQGLSLLSLDGEDHVREQLGLLRALDTQLGDVLGCIGVAEVDGAKLRSPGVIINTLRAEGRRRAEALARYIGVSIHQTPWGPVGVHQHVTHRG